MKHLTKRAEELLKEILEHRLSNGNCDTEYWKERFESLSVADDALLRSLFKELKEAGMISTSWADDYPYILLLLGNGISYFDEKQMSEDYPSPNSNTNFFYGPVSGVQIQQGTVNSTQSQTITAPLDESKIIELINSIRKYDSVLDGEYGKENANELRNAVTELESTRNKHNSEGKKRGLIAYIRDLSVNAGGGLIATGILQLISNILG